MAITLTAKCPICDAELKLVDPVIREVVECIDCGSELEVVEVNGKEVVLTEAELEGEDWGE